MGKTTFITNIFGRLVPVLFIRSFYQIIIVTEPRTHVHCTVMWKLHFRQYSRMFWRSVRTPKCAPHGKWNVFLAGGNEYALMAFISDIFWPTSACKVVDGNVQKVSQDQSCNYLTMHLNKTQFFRTIEHTLFSLRKQCIACVTSAACTALWYGFELW